MQEKLGVKTLIINSGKAEVPGVFMVGKGGSSAPIPEGGRAVPVLVAKETTLSGSHTGEQRKRKLSSAALW